MQGSSQALTPRPGSRRQYPAPSLLRPGWQKRAKTASKNRQPLRHLLSSNGARRHHVNAVLHHKDQQPASVRAPLIAAMSAAVSGVFCSRLLTSSSAWNRPRPRTSPIMACASPPAPRDRGAAPRADRGRVLNHLLPLSSRRWWRQSPPSPADGRVRSAPRQRSDRQSSGQSAR